MKRVDLIRHIERMPADAPFQCGLAGLKAGGSQEWLPHHGIAIF